MSHVGFHGFGGRGTPDLIATNGQTGVTKWASATGQAPYSSPTVGADGTVYIGSEDGYVRAIKGTSGLADSPWPKFQQNVRNTGQPGNVGPPTLSRQPANQAVAENSKAAFSVYALGSPPLRYQWQAGGQAIAGATNSVLAIPQVLSADSGKRYSVVVSNSFGTVRSAEAILTVAPTVHILTVSTVRPGTVKRNPDLTAYPANSVVELSALPGEGRSFVRWSGDTTSKENPLRLTVTNKLAIVAEFSGLPGELLWKFDGVIPTPPAIGPDGAV